MYTRHHNHPAAVRLHFLFSLLEKAITSLHDLPFLIIPTKIVSAQLVILFLHPFSNVKYKENICSSGCQIMHELIFTHTHITNYTSINVIPRIFPIMSYFSLSDVVYYVPDLSNT